MTINNGIDDNTRLRGKGCGSVGGEWNSKRVPSSCPIDMHAIVKHTQTNFRFSPKTIQFAPQLFYGEDARRERGEVVGGL